MTMVRTMVGLCRYAALMHSALGPEGYHAHRVGKVYRPNGEREAATGVKPCSFV